MQITQAAFDAIVAHARDALPNECCGLLIGSGDRVDAAMRARNLEESPTRFLIDPLDHFTAIRLARMNGRAVVGVYHSHPRGPEAPSPRDHAEASYREYAYVIVVPEQPTVLAFRLDGGEFAEVPLVTVAG